MKQNKYLSLQQAGRMNQQPCHESPWSGNTMPQVKKLQSVQLFGGANEVLIAHLGELYQLTLTKQKKLLLTKIKQDFAR